MMPSDPSYDPPESTVKGESAAPYRQYNLNHLGKLNNTYAEGGDKTGIQRTIQHKEGPEVKTTKEDYKRMY